MQHSSSSFMEDEDLENEIVLLNEIYFANEKREKKKKVRRNHIYLLP
jgi:hypothetical protein